MKMNFIVNVRKSNAITNLIMNRNVNHLYLSETKVVVLLHSPEFLQSIPGIDNLTVSI